MIWFWLLFAFLRLPSLFEPYWYGDEGIYLALGQAIKSGVALYSQIHDNKPPTLYLLAALSQTVFGFRLLLLLWMIPTILAFKHLLAKFLSPKSVIFALYLFLILTSIPLIEGHIANAEIFMLLPTILAFILFPKQLFLSGLLLGLAFTIKVPVAFEFLFLFCWLFFVEKISAKFKKLLVFSVGFSLPTLFFTIYYYFQGSLPQYLSSALFQNIGYLSSWTTGTHAASASSSGMPTRFLLLVISWVILFFLYRRQKIDRQSFFVVGWFASTIFAILLSLRPYPHYLIQVVPPLILIIFLIHRQLLLFLFILAVFVYSLISVKFYFYPVFRYYQNSYSYFLGFRSVADYRSFFGWNINYIYQLSDQVVAKSKPTDRLFIWSDDPYLYPLTNRLPVGKYTTAYHIVDFNGYWQTLDSLKTILPKIIIYNSSMTSRPFPDLDQFIADYYYLDNQVGPYYLFLLRP